MGINITFALIIGGIILGGLFLIGLVFSRLYNRASPEEAFVRSGMGGRKVVMSGGALVIPILHETINVNMKTMRLEIHRTGRESLITSDKLRVDVSVAFFTRVAPNDDAIAMAAQTLGERTMEVSQVKELVEPKFANALRDVAARMTITELQHNRADFVAQVLESVSHDLEKNGLELESVSLTALDQTEKQYFNPDNVFDAEGLTKITEQTEQRRKERNDIEQSTEVAIKNRNYEAEKERLRISQEEEQARLSQVREVAYLTADQEAAVAERQAQKKREAREAELQSEEAVEKRRIAKERAVREAEIMRERDIELTEQERKIAVAEKSREESKAKAAADAERAEAAKAEESVVTARETAAAERRKGIAVIKATEEAEEQAVGVKVHADAERQAAEDRAEAQLTLARAKKESDELEALGAEARYKADAEGQRLLNEAANLLSNDQVSMKIRLAMIAGLPDILREQLKPVEKVQSIKVLSMPGGMGNGVGGPAGGGSGSTGDFAQDLLNGMLRYRMQSPVIDEALKELGLDGSKPLSDSLAALQSNKSPATPEGDVDEQAAPAKRDEATAVAETDSEDGGAEEEETTA